MNQAKIFLKNYKTMANIGIYDFEKIKEQPIEISVELNVRRTMPDKLEDDIRFTVDYDFIRRSIQALVSSGHLQTQEYLVHTLIEQFLSHPDVISARVSSEKLNVYPESCSVGYEYFSQKELV